MLSVGKCRLILGKEAEGKADDEIAELLDSLYTVARIVLDAREKEKRREDRSPTAEGFSGALTLLPETDRIAVDERASIMEFEAHLDRDEAERRAVLLYLDQNSKKGLNHG